ncbi:MAG: stage III sporulation protein AC [Clostridium sp.]
MLDISIIIKIAVVGIVTIILDKVLNSAGKGEYGILVNLTGMIIVLILVINLVTSLFKSIQTLFYF